jgi:phage recombination protein Bet
METKPAVKEERLVEFIPVGCTDKIKLSVKIVQNLIAVPTRSGKTCSERDALKFIMLCAAKKLNPFESDAFLVGYDGQNGPEFSLITAHQALLKRCELHPEYDGMQSGVIVKDDSGLKDLEGDFHLDDQELVGAWAKVFFKTRKYPSTDRIALKSFIKTTKDGTPTKFWKENPAGQLCKCAEASAMRKAFPTMCGGMYLREEVSLLGEGIGVIPQPNLDVTEHAEATHDDDSNSGLNPQKRTEPAAGDSPQAQLAALAAENSLSFDSYQKWCADSGNDPEASSRADWSEIPADVCKRFLRARGGFISGLKTFEKGGGA